MGEHVARWGRGQMEGVEPDGRQVADGEVGQMSGLGSDGVGTDGATGGSMVAGGLDGQSRRPDREQGRARWGVGPRWGNGGGNE